MSHDGHYWWYSNEDCLLRYGDGRKAELGVTHIVDPLKLKPNKYGLHASSSALIPLAYAPGPLVWLVSLSGRVLDTDDRKLVASERHYVMSTDAKYILLDIAAEYATSLLSEWCDNAPGFEAALRGDFGQLDWSLASSISRKACLGIGQETRHDAARCAWAALQMHKPGFFNAKAGGSLSLAEFVLRLGGSLLDRDPEADLESRLFNAFAMPPYTPQKLK